MIDACIHRNVLYETELYHNCVFIGNDEKGVARYGCYRSTNDLKMMGDLAGSDKRYSFRTNSEGSDLHVFESPMHYLSVQLVIEAIEIIDYIDFGVSESVINLYRI